jgi:hypothetical protein
MFQDPFNIVSTTEPACTILMSEECIIFGVPKLFKKRAAFSGIYPGQAKPNPRGSKIPEGL